MPGVIMRTLKGCNSLLGKLSLRLILFIDAINFSIIFPVLAVVSASPNFALILEHASSVVHVLDYGLLVAVYMLTWFVSTFVMNRYTSEHGVKRSILVCLLVAVVGYILAAIGFYEHSFWLLLFARAVSGIGAASQPLAQGYLSCGREYAKENKSFTPTFILLLGMVCGPLLGYVLAMPSLSGVFHLAFPMLVLAGMAIGCLLLVWICFKPQTNFMQSSAKPLAQMKDFFVTVCERGYLVQTISFALFLFAWCSFYFFMPIYIEETLHFNVMLLSMFLSCFGCGLVLGNLLLRRVVMWLGLFSTLAASISLAILGCISMLVFNYELSHWLAVVLLSMVISVAYPTFLAVFSSHFSGHDNAIAYTKSSGYMMVLVFAAGSLIGGLLDNIAVAMPLILALCGFAASLVIMLIKRNDYLS